MSVTVPLRVHPLLKRRLMALAPGPITVMIPVAVQVDPELNVTLPASVTVGSVPNGMVVPDDTPTVAVPDFVMVTVPRVRDAMSMV